MEGLCYVIPVTGHKAYTGKEEEEEVFYVQSVVPSFTFLAADGGYLIKIRNSRSNMYHSGEDSIAASD
jgi:hypothetical protein